jgi:formylglycine-generating enzyme required for sulfatase activity
LRYHTENRFTKNGLKDASMSANSPFKSRPRRKIPFWILGSLGGLVILFGAGYFFALGDGITEATPTPDPLADDLARARAGISANADWTPVFATFDGVEMTLVPVGCFLMGDDTGVDDQRPAHEQCLSAPFWLDRTEVSQGQFAALGGVKNLPDDFRDPAYPVHNITWAEAELFCRLRGGRLPTEVEWEYAARGVDGTLYPWGADWASGRVLTGANAGGRPAEVGAFPSGASWVGALNMAGNVWERTSSLKRPYPYNPDDGREALAEFAGGLVVARGGGWNVERPNLFTTTTRGVDEPTEANPFLGFRCLREVE